MAKSLSEATDRNDTFRELSCVHWEKLLSAGDVIGILKTPPVVEM